MMINIEAIKSNALTVRNMYVRSQRCLLKIILVRILVYIVCNLVELKSKELVLYKTVIPNI